MRSLFAYAFIIFACSSMTFANKPLRGSVAANSQEGRSPASGYCMDAAGSWEPAPPLGKCPNGAEPYQSVKMMCLDSAGSWEYPDSNGSCRNGSDPIQVKFKKDLHEESTQTISI